MPRVLYQVYNHQDQGLQGKCNVPDIAQVGMT